VEKSKKIMLILLILDLFLILFGLYLVYISIVYYGGLVTNSYPIYILIIGLMLQYALFFLFYKITKDK